MTAICGMGGSGHDMRAYGETKRSTAGERFRALDADRDGAVTREEFGKALEMLMALTGRNVAASRADDIFSKLDGNADGKVTLDEFKSALESHGKRDGGRGIPDRGASSLASRSTQSKACVEYLSRNSCGASVTTASVDAQVSSSSTGITISVKIAIASGQNGASIRG